MKKSNPVNGPIFEWRCNIFWMYTTSTGLQLQETLENVKPFEG